ncbi:FAD-dependent monooxygenase [Actinosynnema pretiosum subsp. pretiosum]|uniref:FAD-dependent monooxygenase n=1 Tax=Actinosynnema pretiosum subsp. pretiosum TaxID=103721 RepID=A0AA45L7C6_9PSEU|nr:Salicylate hydroxylase [Actinosynnema pretiosum subsp. pretiosum]QUF04418.1 FAD-dependent monooxygenase [Actinosynnema pretiosum subsp. pretiosum]
MNSSGRVVVVGAGPVGLWLAAELALGGATPVVLEREPERSPHSKALGLHPRTLEVLALRGVEGGFLRAGGRTSGWHFGMLPTRLDFSGLPTPFPFLLTQPQAETERLLEERARALGVEVLRGHEVTGLTQDADGVVLRVAGRPDVRAEYVVGADGAGSAVRAAAGIEFPGTESTHFGFLGDVVLADPPPLPNGWHTAEGALMAVPLPDGRSRLVGYDPRAGREPLTLDGLRAVTRRIAGTDFGAHSPSWLSRFGNATKVAARYRQGRVLLAGDAAHRNFPAGGVGLNVGVQDAMNLGWKLAAVLTGRAPESLLDGYHAERWPVGVQLAEHTQAQTALITGVSPEGRALRKLLSELLAGDRALLEALAAKLSALDVAYPDPAGHPVAGARVPLREGLFEHFHSGAPVLLTTGTTGTTGPDGSVAGVAAVRVTPDDLPGSGVAAALVRPDGHVWRAFEDADDLGAIEAAVRELWPPAAQFRSTLKE